MPARNRATSKLGGIGQLRTGVSNNSLYEVFHFGRRLCITVSLVAVIGLTGCGSGTPSVNSARAALQSSIDEGEGTRLQLVSFEKTDGRATEFMGTKGYDLLFAAEAEFVSNAMFSVGPA